MDGAGAAVACGAGAASGEDATGIVGTGVGAADCGLFESCANEETDTARAATAMRTR